MDGRWWVRRVLAVAVGIVMLLLSTSAGEAQSMTYIAQTCRRMALRQVPGGSELDVSQCGNRFTTQDGYVVLVVTLYNVSDGQTVDAELVDPSGTQVWTRRWTLAAPTAGSDQYWESASFWSVLPINPAASPMPLLAAGRVIALEGKPAAERLGEWAFRARVGSSGRLQRTFTLSAP